VPSRSLFHSPKLVLVERPCRLLRTKEILHWELADPFLKRLLIYPWAMWYSCFVFVTAWFLMSSTAVWHTGIFPGWSLAALSLCAGPVPGKQAIWGTRVIVPSSPLERMPVHVLLQFFLLSICNPIPSPLPQIHRMLFRFLTIRFRGCVWFRP